MCWAAVVDGWVFLHWFAPGSTVTGPAYLRLLKEEFWPQVCGEVGRQGFWFQQDGAAVHTTAAVRQWLDDNFDGRVISRLTERPWPARSPDLSPLNFWFWAVALAALRRNPQRPSKSSKPRLKGLLEVCARKTRSARCAICAAKHLPAIFAAIFIRDVYLFSF